MGVRGFTMNSIVPNLGHIKKITFFFKIRPSLVQKLSMKKTVLLEKMVILLFREQCNSFTQSISFPEYACSQVKPAAHESNLLS
jgi:hypothetical protein